MISHAVPKIRPQVRTRVEEFGLLVFTNRTPILAFNKDSQAIWEAIDGTLTINEISSLLLSDSDAAGDEVRNAVIRFILACHELDLLEMSVHNAGVLGQFRGE